MTSVDDSASASGGSGTDRAEDAGPRATAIRWARRWPHATGSLVAVAVWLATNAILTGLFPATPPPIMILGYLLGVLVGVRVAGLDRARGWLVVPVATLALGLIVDGALLAIQGAPLP